jgi:hypothetical protein
MQFSSTFLLLGFFECIEFFQIHHMLNLGSMYASRKFFELIDFLLSTLVVDTSLYRPDLFG